MKPLTSIISKAQAQAILQQEGCVYACNNVDTGEFCFVDCHGVPEQFQFNPGWVPTTYSIPMRATPRQSLPSGIIRNVDDLIAVFYYDKSQKGELSMSEYLDTMSQQRKNITSVANKLQGLADAAYRLGVDTLGVKLNLYANKLFDAEEYINNAVSEELSRTRQAAEQSAGATIAAALAMSELHKQKTDQPEGEDS